MKEPIIHYNANAKCGIGQPICGVNIFAAITYGEKDKDGVTCKRCLKKLANKPKPPA